MSSSPAGGDDADLSKFGYSGGLNRAFGGYTSFALSFSMITITTTIFTLFTNPFTTIGGVGIWLWIPVTLGVVPLALVYGHLGARLPITGYAYQWSSRLVGRNYGALVGWVAMCSFFVGTASIALAMGSVFAAEIWPEPSRTDIQIVAGATLLAAVVINVIGVRLAGLINNIGASTELIGTLGLAAVVFVGLFFFHHTEGPKVLFDTHPVGGGAITITTLGLAALLPIFTLLGWEGAADLAEETKDPRRTAPMAMIRSVVISGLAGFAVYAILAMAIPHGVEDTVNQTENPVFYVIKEQLGPAVGNLVKIIALISIFSALIANVTVATRMCFSLARDHMLPASKTLAQINPRTKTPIVSVLVVGAFAMGINLLSAGLVNKVLSLTAVAYYSTYVLTMAAVLIGLRKHTIPTAPSRYFGLGKWLAPTAWIGIAWSLVVIAYGTLPEGNRVAAQYFGYAVLIGVAWWVLYLRRKIATGAAGPPQTMSDTSVPDLDDPVTSR
jgi:amino acid transporter